MQTFKLSCVAVLLAALTVTTGCLSWPGPTGDPRVEKLYGGAEGYELIAIPALADIRAYRVHADLGKAPGPVSNPTGDELLQPKTIGGYAVTAGPVTPDDAAKQEMSTILKSGSTYGWDLAKGCVFNPGVAVRFIGHDTTLDVLFCFGCKELMVFKNGKRVGGEDFDDKAEELLALAKRWFPEMK